MFPLLSSFLKVQKDKSYRLRCFCPDHAALFMFYYFRRIRESARQIHLRLFPLLRVETPVYFVDDHRTVWKEIPASIYLTFVGEVETRQINAALTLFLHWYLPFLAFTVQYHTFTSRSSNYKLLAKLVFPLFD